MMLKIAFQVTHLHRLTLTVVNVWPVLRLVGRLFSILYVLLYAI